MRDDVFFDPDRVDHLYVNRCKPAQVPLAEHKAKHDEDENHAYGRSDDQNLSRTTAVDRYRRDCAHVAQWNVQYEALSWSERPRIVVRLQFANRLPGRIQLQVQ